MGIDIFSKVIKKLVNMQCSEFPNLLNQWCEVIVTDKEYFAEKFVQCFPEYESEYQEHVKTYGEVLGHVFFGDAIDSTLFSLLMKNSDVMLIKKFIDFIEDMYANGDDAIKNVVEVTILEYLGDDDIALKNAYTYFSEDLMQASKKVEAWLRRRKIHIHYRKGKVFADW